MPGARRAAVETRKLKPPRPKRPLTAYVTFIKEYMKSKPLKSREDCQNAMREGARRWREMTKTEKSKYESKVVGQRQRYMSEMKEYNEFVNALKCPRNSYTTFLCDYYACQYGPVNVQYGRFGINSKEAASIWKTLDSGKKGDYLQKYHENWAYRQRLVSGEEPLPSLSYNEDEEDEEEQEEDVEQNNAPKASYSKRNGRSYKIEDIIQQDVSPANPLTSSNRKNSSDGQENSDEGSTGRRRTIRKRKGNPISYTEKKPRKSSKLRSSENKPTENQQSTSGSTEKEEKRTTRSSKQ